MKWPAGALGIKIMPALIHSSGPFYHFNAVILAILKIGLFMYSIKKHNTYTGH
jgi:hypothetical protein